MSGLDAAALVALAEWESDAFGDTLDEQAVDSLHETVARILAARVQAPEPQGGGLTDWPCDDYKAPLTCWTTPKPKTLICEGCRTAFPSGPKVQAVFTARAVPAETLADRVRALIALGVREQWPPDEWRAGLLRLLDPAEQPATREDGEA